jgi:23S rRNA maturation-related 3'-5' exoribonuclease YhaM
MTNVEKLSLMADSLKVMPLARRVLENPKFPLWTAAAKPEQHHYGQGMLVQHTFEVCELCLKTNEYFKTLGKGVDDGKLFLAALFHDSGKMWDYEPVVVTGLYAHCLGVTPPVDYKDWQKTKHARQVYHITRSVMEWEEAKSQASINTFDADDEVLHAIIAHHGRREWGSSTSPCTRMAWLLHLCDNLSARMDDCLRLDSMVAKK